MTPDQPLSDDALATLAARAAAWPDAPPALLRAAFALWQEAPEPAWRQVVREVVAVLRFDSWAQTAVASGMRGQAAGDSRHLLFSAEGRDIDLRIAPAGPGAWQVAGQVLGPDEAGELMLVQAGDAADPLIDPAVPPLSRLRAALDDLGEFRFESVGAGRWALTLQLADQAVRLPEIEVGLPRP